MDAILPVNTSPIHVPDQIREDAGASLPMLKEAVQQVDAGVRATMSTNTAHAQALDESVSKINDLLSQQGRSLQFSVDRSTGRTVVKVIDMASGELIRQIPSEQWLSMAHAMLKIPGGGLLREQA